MVLSIASLAWSSTHSNFCAMWQMARQTALPYLQYSNVSTVATDGLGSKIDCIFD